MAESALREFAAPAIFMPRPRNRGRGEKAVSNDLPVVLAHADRRGRGSSCWLSRMRDSAPGWLLRLTLHDLMVFTLAGGIFCYFISRYLTKPLYKLGEAAASIAEGRLDTRVDPSLRNRRDEIAGLARNFDRMAERIETLITGQRRLLGDVSHELRSPLSRLIVALSLVKQGPAEEAAENLERIGLEARRLDTLIGQLLALTRIDSGVDRGSPARFDLTNLVQEVANDGDFEARARNRSVVDRTSRCVHGNGFEELLRSAVENVVRNAIRHTRRRNGGGDFAAEPAIAACSASGAGPRAGSAGKHAVRDLLAVPAVAEWQFRRGRSRACDRRTGGRRFIAEPSAR